MRTVLFCNIVALSGCAMNHPHVQATNPPPGKIDFAYFDGDAAHPERQSVVVIGRSFSEDATKPRNCQTRTGTHDQPSAWHDAIVIGRAREDEYKFKPADTSASAAMIEVRVLDAAGQYTASAVVGDGTDYWERFRTFASPHDCIGKTVQVRWCQDPKPRLGSKVCPDTKHSLVCQNKGDYVVVGVHFAAGTVSQVKISFDYSQIDLNNVGSVSNSVLRRAIVKDDSECPREGAFRDVQPLKEVYTPDEIRCFPAADVATPGEKDVVVHYMFKRKTWPATLNINNVHIETTMAIRGTFSPTTGRR